MTKSVNFLKFASSNWFNLAYIVWGTQYKIIFKGGLVMKATFYDVKQRQKVETEVTEKVVYGDKGRERYAFRGKTSDGRNLTKFVSKDEWQKANV